MSGGVPVESADDLYENAPCGYLSTRPDGTILRVNRTFERWTGLRREDLIGHKRFRDLLNAGGRIYHETHYAPLLRMQGEVREIAVEIVRADGSRLPTLVNSVLHCDADGQPSVIRTTVFDASDRRRYERELLEAQRAEHEIAAQLQRGLLSNALPEVSGLEVEVVYRSGSRDVEVGGDWYDLFCPTADGGAVVVVGDVVGRGIGAAVQMAQLRSAVRAFAATGLSPAGVLTALDEYAERHHVGKVATLVCAQLDRRARELRYSCAGHPPPLLICPGGKPEFLWEGRSLPIAAAAAGVFSRDEGSYALPPGSTLVLYTDGLVERRDRGIDIGMEMLLAAAESARKMSTAELAHDLMNALHEREHSDDVCLLVVRSAES